MTCGWAKRTSSPIAGPGKVHALVLLTINGPNRPICLVQSAPNVEPAPPSCCRPATAKPCSSISTRSQPKSHPEHTPFSSWIRPAGMAPKPWWSRATSHSCHCRRAHPNSTARKTSGSSCARIGCQTGFSNPSTISSTTAATLGTHSSNNPGRSCPSRDATGQQSVTQSEDWYNMFYLVAGFALLFYILLDRLVHSPIGETLTAIREDEVSAASLGINCTAWKVFAFGIGSAVAGAAGCFFSSFVRTFVADAFFLSGAFNILPMVILVRSGTLVC